MARPKYLFTKTIELQTQFLDLVGKTLAFRMDLYSISSKLYKIDAQLLVDGKCKFSVIVTASVKGKRNDD